MQSSNDLELSRRAVVLGGAASVALTTISTGTALAQSAQVVGPQLATIPVALEINGKVRDLHLDTRTTLLDALREHLQLTGTKSVELQGLSIAFTSPGPKGPGPCLPRRLFPGCAPRFKRALHERSRTRHERVRRLAGGGVRRVVDR